MSRKVVLLIILLTAIAVMSCNQLPTQVVPPAPAGEAVGGEEIASRSVRLFSDPQKINLAFEFENGRVYRGPVSRGQTILYFDGRRIFRGSNATGEILFTVSGNRIFVGPNTTGALAYTVANGRVYEGSRTGPIVYTIEGDRLFRGPNTTGDIVLQANRELSGNVRFLLPILADQRF